MHAHLFAQLHAVETSAGVEGENMQALEERLFVFDTNVNDRVSELQTKVCVASSHVVRVCLSPGSGAS